jgi:alkanesulfonate monooxygenase SsuD/methylene tetrahydromethanopterin reductase-like flavin-dependent oxidoreductase (luciferase family)
VELSMTLPTMVPHDRASTRAWCAGVDAGPWASLAVPERITYPSHALTVELAAAAALTERVRLWTTIVVLPMRDPVLTAKELASVDVLADGRLTVGIGVGGREHDYRAVGASFERRWDRLDEAAARMQAVWRGEPPFEGADPVGPPPVQPGGPPLVAGAMGPKAIARAARWAVGVDGAWTLDGDEATMRSAFEAIDQAWRDAGRDDAPHKSSSLWYALGPDAEARLRAYARDYLAIFGPEAAAWAEGAVRAFTPAALRDAVGAAEAAGADEFFLVPTSGDPDELTRTRDALGR